MNRSSSIAARAALALLLTIGFYLLALGMAAGLLFIPYAEVRYAHRINAKLTLFAIAGAVAILWSILPRIDRFVVPGPRLRDEDQPEMFRVLRDVADRCREAMPSEVYLVGDLNAWVSQRGGVMGIGSRRVMGLGLPLLQSLTVSETRAVIAHEFGHYYGGDTKLGPWVYKTRGAIGRTLSNLAGQSSLVQKPFLWYGQLFLRVTQAVSRRQEFMADALAARVVGANALASGLKKVHTAGAAFHAYWSQEVVPILQSGFVPPLADGFQRFVSNDRIRAALAKQSDEEMREGKADPYDTHPPLRERVAALAEMPSAADPEDERLAIVLLNGVDRLEMSLLAEISSPEHAGKLRPVQWDDVPSTVLLPSWIEVVHAEAKALSSVSVRSLPDYAQNAVGFANSLAKGPPASQSSEEERRAAALWVLGIALAVTLNGDGWSVTAAPGEPVRLTREGSSCEPFAVVHELASGALRREEWQRRCESDRYPERAFAAAAPS